MTKSSAIVYDSAQPAGGLIRWWLKLFEQHEVIEALTWRDIKSRYQQSLLGFYWTIVNPLATALVFTLVFSFIMRVPTGDTPYVVFILTGLLGWNFFANSLYNATGSLVGLASLLSKVSFPREILPISAVLARLLDFAVSLLVLIIIMFLYGRPPSPLIVLAPVILLVQLVFTIGMGMILSALNLFFRDVAQLLSILLMLWMFLTPVIYPAEQIPVEMRPFFALNPMTPIIEAYRDTIIDGRLPAAGPFLLATGVSVVVFILGYLLFKRLEPHFAEAV